MPTDYAAEKVKCPFYKEEDEKTIKCTGTVSKVCSQCFKTPKRKQAVKEEYCNTFNYRNCPHYKEVLKSFS